MNKYSYKKQANVFDVIFKIMTVLIAIPVGIMLGLVGVVSKKKY